MRKSLPITLIFLLLTLSMTPLAMAQKQNIITNKTTETLYVISSTKFGAQDDIPAGYRTSGWKTVEAGQQETFWAYDPHKIYFQIWKESGPIKPQPATGTFGFWIHRSDNFDNFDIVTQQEINDSITRAELLYSSHGTNPLTHSDGFMVYDNGSRITVTNDWVPVPLRANIITNQTTEVLSVVYSTKFGAQDDIPAGYRTSGWKTVSGGQQREFRAYDPHNIYFQIWKAGKPIKPQPATGTFGFWINRNAGFDIVTRQEINASITRAELLYSSQGTNPLTHHDGFMRYDNGSQITVTNAWVDVEETVEAPMEEAEETVEAPMGEAEETVDAGPPEDGTVDETVDAGPPEDGIVEETVEEEPPEEDGIVEETVEEVPSEEPPDLTGILVNIPDPNLRAAIEKALGKSKDATIILADMLTLTSLDISETATEDLTGIEYGINLRQLNLSNNWIEDLSPLASLRNLRELDLSRNAISDLSPLASLRNLRELDLSENAISDLSPLASLRNLTSLNLSNNWIEDLSPLAGLTRLTSLNLAGVLIEDLSLLAGLTRLTSLNLAGVPIPIEDVSPLAGLTNLRELNLSLNSISDLSPLAGLTNLMALDLSENAISDLSSLASLTNLTSLNLSNNQIEDVSPLASLTTLKTLALYSNYQIEDVSPLAGLTNLTSLNLSENSISDLSPLAGLTNLTELYLFYNRISDFSPIADLIPNLETYHSGNQRFSTVAVDPEVPVNIPDPVLRAAIENELGKSPGTRITQAEMATLTSFNFDDSEVSIQDLTGLEFAVSLTKLHVGGNKISDVSALAGLKHLTWLDLASNLILDVSALAGLNNLIWLDLSYNPYTYRIGSEGLNIVPIAQLQNLIHLDLAWIRISDVAPIAQLKNLSSLELSSNAISDISPIAALKGLERLKLFDNTISDVSALADLKNLQFLYLSENAISDISPLSDLTNLRVLGLSSNVISDISPLTRLEYLTSLYLSNNQISDFSPIAHLIPNLEKYDNNNQAPLTVVDPGAPVHIPDPNLRTTIANELGKSAGARITQAEMTKLWRLRVNNRGIQDLTGLEFAINLTSLDLSYNQISDVSPLAGLEDLRYLVFSGNQISDISPLAALENLTFLDLSYNWIADFSPIKHLIPNLETYQNSDQDSVAVAVDPEASVEIPDPVLRTAIEKELGKPPGTTITQAEMATLISFSSTNAGIHDIADPGIQDLTGLEFAINLQTLRLDWVLHIPTNTYRQNRSISDISPLANLHNLTELHLSGNQISDVSPLAALENLTHLDLGFNRIRHRFGFFSAFSALKNLVYLDLSTMNLPTIKISDISPLAALENLKVLDFSLTQISDVSPLAALENLVSLNLYGNQISDVSPLTALENLTDLNLSNNQISDISPLAALENLTHLDLSNTRTSDVSPLAALKNLWRLYLSDNRISDVAPLAALKNLLELKLNDNQILDFSPIADLIPNLNVYENSNQVSLTAAANPETPVHIPDVNLRTYIENELGKSPGTTITQAEMATLTSLSPFEMRDLTGIEFAINLRGLYIWESEVSDVSALTALENLEGLVLARCQLADVSSLAALENLEVLRLSENQILDVSSLAALENLISLYLDNNAISDISALANLRNLTKLDLSKNRVSDVSSLAALENLTSLYLSNNQIADASALTALGNLTSLSLSHNQISDASALAALENLISLSLAHNQISDASALAALENLISLYLDNNAISDISALAALENLISLYLDNNAISDISALAALENLEELSLSHNQISDISALANLHNLTELYLSNNQISDISALANLHNLTELYLSNNQTSDASALTALENLTSVDVVLVPFCLTLDPPPPPKSGQISADLIILNLVVESESDIWTKADTIYEESLSDGVVLTVKFLNGPDPYHDAVKMYAPLWEDHGAVRFKFTTTGTSDINIHFDSGENKAKRGSPGVHTAREGLPTMWLTTIDQQTILHEFGHALGFVHEHQTPAESDLDLDTILKDAKARYEKEGLSEKEREEKLEANYERLNAGGSTNFSDFSEFDPESIMLYGGLPLKNGGQTEWNDDLSDLDKKYIGIFYPKPDPLISSIRVHGISDGESIESRTTRTLEVSVHAKDGSRIPDKAVAFSFSDTEPGALASAAFIHTLAHTDQLGGAAKTKVTFTGQNDHVIISVKVAGSSLKEDFKIFVKGKPAVSTTQEIDFRVDARHTLWEGKRDWAESVYVKPPIDGARVTITKVEVSAKEVDQGRIKWWNPLCLCWAYGPWGTAGIYEDKTKTHNMTVSYSDSFVNIEGWVEDGLYQHASVEVTGTIHYEYVAAAPSAWAELPQETSLLHNYPNPFNPETWIPYHLAEPADVTLTIYAVNGQVVRRLDLGHQAAGFYRSRARAAYWDGRNAVGERVASGIYFYTLMAGEFAATRKLLIRK